MTTRNEGRLRSEGEAALLLATSTRTLQRLRRAGNGPRNARLGRRVLYGEAGLAEWVAARTVAGRADERVPGEA